MTGGQSCKMHDPPCYPRLTLLALDNMARHMLYQHTLARRLAQLDPRHSSRVTARVPIEIRRAIVATADRIGLSLSDAVRVVLSRGLALPIDPIPDVLE